MKRMMRGGGNAVMTWTNLSLLKIVCGSWTNGAALYSYYDTHGMAGSALFWNWIGLGWVIGLITQCQVYQSL